MTKIIVPFLDLKAQYSSIQKEINQVLQNILHAASFIKGPYLEKFEKEFADFLGVTYCVGVASGTDALHIGLKALGVTHGDEVIVPVNTFAATAYAVLYCGAKPVLVDTDEKTYNIDVNKIEKAITKKTKAIIPVHLYGNPAEMKEINQIAKRHDFFVFEDACQAHGSWYGKKRAGNLGDLAAFSFYPGKNLGAYGDGGVIVTNSLKLATQIKKLREYGSLKKYEYEIIGFNSRLDALQGAILSVKLKHLEKWNIKRQKAAAYYTKLFQREVPEIIPPKPETVRNSVFHLYVIRTRKRKQLMSYLAEKGIQTLIHYPVPLHLQKSLKELRYKKGDFPVSETLSNEILSLPIYPEITREQQDYVVAQIKKFFNKPTSSS